MVEVTSGVEQRSARQAHNLEVGSSNLPARTQGTVNLVDKEGDISFIVPEELALEIVKYMLEGFNLFKQALADAVEMLEKGGLTEVIQGISRYREVVVEADEPVIVEVK